MPRLVGRDSELARLREAAVAAAAGQGGAVVVDGPRGAGKATLLRAFADAVAGRWPQGAIAWGRCHEDTEANAFEPFAAALQDLVRRGRQQERTKEYLQLIGDVGADLLTLIPGLGAALGVLVRSGTRLASAAVGDPAAPAPGAATPPPALQYVATLEALAASHPPLILLIEDLQWADAASCQVLRRLLPRLRSLPLLLVLSMRGDEVASRSPVVTGDTGVRGVVDGAIADGQLVHLVLRNWTEADIRTYLETTRGDVPHAAIPRWLRELTDGLPHAVVAFVDLLSERGLLDGALGQLTEGTASDEVLATLELPRSLQAALQQRLRTLPLEDQELLRAGALQGRRFLSAVCVSVLGSEELPVLERLRTLAAERGLLAADEAEDWELLHSDAYAFVDALLPRMLLQPLSRRELLLRHRAVADALALLAEQHPPTRSLLLQLARHRRLGGQALDAAGALLHAAISCTVEGAYADAATLASDGLDCQGAAPAGPDTDRVRVDLTHALVVAGELRWHEGARHGGHAVVASAEQAIAAAQRLGDPRAEAQAVLDRARLAIVLDDLDRALQLYGEAARLAEASRDEVLHVQVLMDAGHHRNSVDARAGFAVLEQAWRRWTEVRPRAADDPTAARTGPRLQALLGVGAYDVGELGVALEHLPDAWQQLVDLRLHDDVVWCASFLGQLRMTLGEPQEAARTLGDALRRIAPVEEPNAWRAYTRALLGLALAALDRPPAAVEAFLDAAAEVRSLAHHAALRSLVPVVCAEGLLACGRDDVDELLDLALADAAGWVRSVVAARSLQAEAALRRGDVRGALEHSRTAVSLLGPDGALAAVRPEAVWHRHGRVAAAAGEAEEAADAFTRAAVLLRRQAASLPDGPRAGFLGTPLAAAITGDGPDLHAGRRPRAGLPSATSQTPHRP